MDNDFAANTQTVKKRILTFDILRGLFLLIILINHIELYPSGFDYFTGRGRLLVSAAEGFFFMSGLLVGIVYRRRLTQGMAYIFKKMWTRALQLYVGSVILTLLFTAGAVYLNHPSIKDGLLDVIDWPYIVSQTLLMRYGFGWADFLNRFAILMFMAPFGFYLIARGKWWLLLGVSLIGWALRENSFTLSWQIIFTLGLIGGYYWNELTAWLRGIPQPLKGRLQAGLVSFSVITFALSYASVYVLSELNARLTQLPMQWQNFTLEWNKINEFIWLYAEKWTVGPIRILLFLAWFSVLFMWVSRHEEAVNRYTRGILELFGRNSLFVYISHAFIVFGFKFAIPHQTTPLANFLITAAAIALQVAVTIAYVKLNKSSRLRKGEPVLASDRYARD